MLARSAVKNQSRENNLIYYMFGFERYLAFTGADTHVAVFSVEGVREQPQTLRKKDRELKMSSKVRYFPSH